MWTKTKARPSLLVKPIGSLNIRPILDEYAYGKGIIQLQKCSSSVGSPITRSITLTVLDKLSGFSTLREKCPYSVLLRPNAGKYGHFLRSARLSMVLFGWFLNIKSSVLHDKPFHAYAPDLFLYSLETLENLGFSGIFRCCRKRSVAWNVLIYFKTLNKPWTTKV